MKSYFAFLFIAALTVIQTSNSGCGSQSDNGNKDTADTAVTPVKGNDEEPAKQEKTIAEVIELTDQTFEETIKTGVTLVDFWAAWCKPCRMQAPVVEEVKKEISDKAKICKLDIDQNKVTAARYRIESIPTIIIFKNGKAVNQFVGVTDKSILINAINQQL